MSDKWNTGSISDLLRRIETAERERDEAREDANGWRGMALGLKGIELERDETRIERDEALKKLEKIKEISQVWNVVDDDVAAKIIALNRIHIIAGGKT